MAEQGLRFNNGKTRYDLLEPWAIEKLAEVFTKGAEKYAPHNWSKGMPWSSIEASLERHYGQYKQCQDYDKETGLLHAAHIAWNAMALLSYYKLAPQFDDRRHAYLTKKRIALDIDDVLADFTGAYAQCFNLPRPTAWQFDRNILKNLAAMEQDGLINDFYLSFEPLIKPEEIPFEPVLYVTCRPVSSEISEQWLNKHGFPAAPVCTVGVGKSKLECLKDNNVDIFIDDAYHNFVELNKGGICTYLFDAEHNQRYDVGYKRIKHLKELI